MGRKSSFDNESNLRVLKLAKGSKVKQLRQLRQVLKEARHQKEKDEKMEVMEEDTLPREVKEEEREVKEPHPSSLVGRCVEFGVVLNCNIVIFSLLHLVSSLLLCMVLIHQSNKRPLQMILLFMASFFKVTLLKP